MFNFTHQLENFKASLIGLVLVLASAIIGLIWISIGLYTLAVVMLGSLWGPVALGGLFLLPIFIYAIVKSLPSSQQKRKQSAFDAAFANTSVGSISRIIESLSGISPILATVAAVVAGFMVTRFPQFLPMFSQIVTALAEELQLRNVRKAENKARKARDEYDNSMPPPPPDVEPVAKRRRKKAEELY